LYLRQHAGGFENGIKTYSYGFLRDDHPDHPDISMLNQRFARITSENWNKLNKEDQKKWKQDLPNVFFGKSGIMIPFNFTKERVTAVLENKEKIMTYALMVSTPTKYGKLVKILLDSALQSKRLNNLIPFALNKESPDGYYYIVAQQARFIENHRNIPIMNVPPEARIRKGLNGETMVDILNKNPAIQRVSYDLQQRKYHVSTTATTYKEVHQWIPSRTTQGQWPPSEPCPTFAPTCASAL